METLLGSFHRLLDASLAPSDQDDADHSVDPPSNSQPLEQRVGVQMHGAYREPKLPGDFRSRHATANEPRHVGLPACQAQFPCQDTPPVGRKQLRERLVVAL